MRFTKILLSVFVSKIPLALLNYLGDKNVMEIEKKVFEELYTKDRKRILEIRGEHLNEMKCRHFSFFMLYFIFCTFSLYYTSIFCVIYNGSCSSWLSDGFLTIFLDYITSFTVILVLSIMRILFMKYHYLK